MYLEMPKFLLPIVHMATMMGFLLILVDCLWKKLLVRSLGYFLPQKKVKRINWKKFKDIKRIYKKHEQTLKKCSSDVVKMKIYDG